MGSGLLAAVRSKAERTAQWAAVALAISIPVSTALDNVLLALVAAGWLLAGAWRETWQAARANPVALAGLGLLALLAVGTLYGTRDPGEATEHLSRYIDLLFIPVFAFLFRDPALRHRAIYVLAASLGLVLALSYLIAAGMPVGAPLRGTPANPIVMKQYLTHGILMAFGAFLFAELALAKKSRWRRTLWFLAALAAAVNVAFMMQSRTAYLLLAMLAMYIGLCRLQRRGRLIALAAMAAVVVALVLVPGPFQRRMDLGSGEQPSSPASEYARTSNAERLEWYRASIAIMRDHPLVGVGTGGFRKAYAERYPESLVRPTRHPHNEYLNIGVQIGLLGVIAVLYLFWAHWRAAPRLGSPLEQHLARGLLLTIAMGCLFNSLLLDHTEGLLYAWLTGLLFAGLRSPSGGSTPAAPRSS